MPLWKEGKFWRIQFQFNKRRYSKQGFATRKAAERWQVEKTKELEEEAKTPVSPKQNGQTSSGSDSSPLTLGGLMMQYMSFAERSLAEKTIGYRKSVFKKFITHVGSIPIPNITSGVVEKYLLTLPTNNGFNKQRTEIHRLFSWAHRRQIIPSNPITLIDKLPVDKKKKVIPTPAEMAKILMAAGPDRPLLLILFHTLARIDEILRLRWEDVNFTKKTVTLWTRKRRGGNWESDQMAMNEDLYEMLWGLYQKREQEEYVFVNPLTGTRYLYRPKLMKTICQRAGVPKYNFHAIRHFVASLLYDKKKVSLPVVSKLLRHKNLATTELYVQAIDPRYREIMKLLEGDVLNSLSCINDEKGIGGKIR
jgi:integrase